MLNNSSFPEKSVNISDREEDDIPVAVRDTPDIKHPSHRKAILIVVSLAALGGLPLSLILSAPTPSRQTTTESSPKPEATTTTAQTNSDSSQIDNVLGHLPYQEAHQSELLPITSDGSIKMRRAAAEKFKEMSAAARANGIILVAISGFRSVEDQKHLFFDVKAQRAQVATKRAEVSAPPGYSEHHTGFAVDIGDGNTPATNLSQSFEQTAAFKWLEQNAARYSFEISFTKGNPQGVSYEPWHWRFVGDTQSLETFYKAKNLPNPNPIVSP